MQSAVFFFSFTSFASSFSLNLSKAPSSAPSCSSSSARLLDPGCGERRGSLRRPLLGVFDPRELGRRARRRRGDSRPVQQRCHGLRRLRSLGQPVADAVELEAQVLGAVLGCWCVEVGGWVGGWGGVVFFFFFFFRRKREEVERIVGGLLCRSPISFFSFSCQIFSHRTWHGVVVSDDLDVLAVSRGPRVGDEDAVEGEVLVFFLIGRLKMEKREKKPSSVERRRTKRELMRTSLARAWRAHLSPETREADPDGHLNVDVQGDRTTEARELARAREREGRSRSSLEKKANCELVLVHSFTCFSPSTLSIRSTEKLKKKALARSFRHTRSAPCSWARFFYPF